MYPTKTTYLKVKMNNKVQPNSSNLEQEICSNITLSNLQTMHNEFFKYRATKLLKQKHNQFFNF